MNLSDITIEWFFKLPGLFITGGVLLILIAILIFIIGASRARSKKANDNLENSEAQKEKTDLTTSNIVEPIAPPISPVASIEPIASPEATITPVEPVTSPEIVPTPVEPMKNEEPVAPNITPLENKNEEPISIPSIVNAEPTKNEKDVEEII